MMKLTNMEKMVLNALRDNDYNDALQDGGTWLFCATEYSGLDTKQARGALSSLVKKELVEVNIERISNESTVGFTEAGEKVFDNADGEECSWGGPRLLKIEEVEEAKVEEVKEEKEMKNLNEMTVKELRAEAKARGIKGYSRISKDDLIEMIKATEADTTKEVEEVVEEKVETVVMKAFTGMLIGEFKVVAETSEAITVETKKGELSFDKKTGIQLNPNNPKFANRIERA